MCKCTPEMKTPFCGAPGCEFPDSMNLDKLRDGFVNMTLELDRELSSRFQQYAHAVMELNSREKTHTFRQGVKMGLQKAALLMEAYVDGVKQAGALHSAEAVDLLYRSAKEVSIKINKIVENEFSD